MRKGICVAGNMIVDILYPTEGWPKRGELVHILDGISRSTGGAVCNVIVDLAKLDPQLPLFAMGKIGEDAEGDVILKKLGEHANIDVSNVIREGISAFTAVMNDVKSNERTFFTYLGANGRFDEDCIDWNKTLYMYLHVRVTNQAYADSIGDTSVVRHNFTTSVFGWRHLVALIDIVAVLLFALAVRGVVIDVKLRKAAKAEKKN